MSLSALKFYEMDSWSQLTCCLAVLRHIMQNCRWLLKLKFKMFNHVHTTAQCCSSHCLLPLHIRGSQPHDKLKLARFAMKLDLVSLARLAGWWAVRYKIVGIKQPKLNPLKLIELTLTKRWMQPILKTIGFDYPVRRPTG